MPDDADAKAQQIDQALKASQDLERQERHHDLERQRRTDEAIVAALAGDEDDTED